MTGMSPFEFEMTGSSPDAFEDEETHGLVSNGSTSQSGRARRKVLVMGRPFAGGDSNVWKVVTLILTGIVLLFATDSIELKIGRGGSDHSVQYKEPTVSPPVSSPVSPPVPSPVSPPVPSPVSPPVPSPVENPEPVEPVEPTDAEEDTKVPSSVARHLYKTRGQPMSKEERKEMISKWGSWTLVDKKERPTEDYYVKYPNRDIPRTEFPSNAWQIDKEYLSDFLPEAIALAERGMEAILAEYGKTDGTFEDRAEMFFIEKIDEGLMDRKPKTIDEKGGWTTTSSWEGLKRRLLHSLMTEDSFVFAMGGHSSAAGHGNHFTQSYTLQVQWILEAVFARLGVKHQARNFGNGGLGTIHNAAAAGSIYGPDVDMLMWDSGMTEKSITHKHLFHIQGLIGGFKVPILWSMEENSLKFLHEETGADVGHPGFAEFGIDKASSLKEIEKMPWAMQYVRCDSELKGVCRANEYMGTCWIERDDYTPQTEQNEEPGGRASWHPGNRIHQVRGRVLAFTILQALKEALVMWNEADGYALPDEAWHVTAHYEAIRAKVLSLTERTDLDETLLKKGGLRKRELEILLKYPLKSRSEFTPRAYAGISSIQSLMRPKMLGNLNDKELNVYDPPDVFNPNLHPPEGAVDVLNILEAGVDFKSVLKPDYTYYYKQPKFASKPKVTLGKGIRLDTHASDHLCDGSVDSFCDRSSTRPCLLYGHNDGRNGMFFDSYSGWVVMNIPDLKNGFVMIKVETWHGARVERTDGWNSINNERKARSLELSEQAINNSTVITTSNSAKSFGRSLGNPPPLCEDFKFEYAIDGAVTSVNKEEFEANIINAARVVEWFKILDDPAYTGGQEKEVEIAVRITGCGQKKAFRMSHIYWS